MCWRMTTLPLVKSPPYQYPREKDDRFEINNWQQNNNARVRHLLAKNQNEHSTPNFLLTWHMNPGMTRWKADPLKWSSLPDRPIPFSPVHKQRKFSAVFGTTSARNSISMRPLRDPPMEMSKKTTGFSADMIVVVSRVIDGVCCFVMIFVLLPSSIW